MLDDWWRAHRLEFWVGFWTLTIGAGFAGAWLVFWLTGKWRSRK